jgi:predicted O-methyltransferase YrrM
MGNQAKKPKQTENCQLKVAFLHRNSMHNRIKKALKLIIPRFIWEKKLPVKIENERFEGGHYYSVIPSLTDVNKRSEEIFSAKDPLLGIDLNREEQIKTLNEFRITSIEKPFSLDKFTRFYIENDSFSYDDAPVLSYMLRKIKPAKIIEIGCGYSSAVMLDTNDSYINNTTSDFTFIDIDFSSLNAKLKDDDRSKVTTIEKPIQEVDLSIFSALGENDLLFIDSSHVAKVGSDLNTILFKILPVLKPGVYIHFHDVRFPFEYSLELINNKIFWNEAYLLRAFLMFNDHFKITFWLNCLVNDPLINKNDLEFLPLHDWDRKFNNSKGDISGAGGSIYLQKVK